MGFADRIVHINERELVGTAHDWRRRSRLLPKVGIGEPAMDHGMPERQVDLAGLGVNSLASSTAAAILTRIFVVPAAAAY